MANIYVRKSGSDSNDGSTPALAKLTIAGAISAMTSGDEIIVGAGIYKERNLTTGSKTVSIIGDETGELTGDFGEVIWSGINDAGTDYYESNYAIYSDNNGYSLTIKNLTFEHWGFDDSESRHLVKKDTTGNLYIENIFIDDVYIRDDTSNSQSLYLFYYYNNSSAGTVSIKNINISNIKKFSTIGSRNTTIRLQAICHYNPINNFIFIVENIKIKNVFLSHVAGSSYQQENYFWGVYSETLSASTTTAPSIKNIEITDCCLVGKIVLIKGIQLEYNNASVTTNIYNCIVNNIVVMGTTTVTSYAFYTSSYGTRTAYNCSASNLISNSTFTAYGNFVESNSVNLVNYTIPKIEPISRFSPLLGQGNTTFPATDIEGNPRPAYGNGTACNIGVSEATNKNVQKESTIKDSGDYSVKVAPCNYFKKTFQVPVTASELRTVKVKIRIDGTWGTYLPRVSLSGQGMTLSQATKNSTTGSFEELTVSGTPSTTGIALLTIEAHSVSTDAVFYIDTITLS